MTYAAVKGVSLEFGSSPQLRGVKAAADLPNENRHFLLSSSERGTARILIQACKSIQALLIRHAKFPDWLVLVDEYNQIPSIADQLLQESSRKYSAAISRHLTSQVVYFYCHTLPDRLSGTEKRALGMELDAAIELLSIASPEAPAIESTNDVDSERRLQLARERRAQLLVDEKWLDAPTVHIQQGGKPNSQGINNTASRLRRRGELLGAWNGREFLHPAFQFNSDTGRLAEEMKPLLESLPKDRSGWRQVFWLFQAHGKLNGRRPADVFASDPKNVIDAARSDFEISDERW
jgi:hypothetical protein